MHAAADAGVLALGVLAHDHPVQIFRLAALQRCIDAGQDAGRPHVGVLVEALADLQPQSPQRDVVGNIRIAGRAEENRVLAAERIEAVGRHHLAVLAVVVAAPGELLELKGELVVWRSQRFQNLPAGGHDFLADAIARHQRNPIRLHFHPSQRHWQSEKWTIKMDDSIQHANSTFAAPWPADRPVARESFRHAVCHSYSLRNSRLLSSPRLAAHQSPWCFGNCHKLNVGGCSRRRSVAHPLLFLVDLRQRHRLAAQLYRFVNQGVLRDYSHPFTARQTPAAVLPARKVLKEPPPETFQRLMKNPVRIGRHIFGKKRRWRLLAQHDFGAAGVDHEPLFDGFDEQPLEGDFREAGSLLAVTASDVRMHSREPHLADILPRTAVGWLPTTAPTGCPGSSNGVRGLRPRDARCG